MKYLFAKCFGQEPEDYEIPEKCQKNLILIGIVISLINEIYTAIKHWIFNIEIYPTNISVFLIFLLASYVLLKKERVRTSAFLLVSGILTTLLICLLHGKYTSLFWFPFVPIAAGILFDQREFVRFTLLTIVLTTAVLFFKILSGELSLHSFSLLINPLSIAADAFIAFLTYVFTIYIYKLFIDTYREKLKNLLDFDYLTKALSRRSLLLNLSKGHYPLYSILMLDIDHFKKINDTYGHKFGDRVLKKLIAVVKKNLRKSDLIGRYGGEEFIIVLPGTSKEEAKKVAEKIRKIVENTDFNLNHPITISLGVADSKEAKDFEELISLADRRLYRAKREGRNKTVAEDTNESFSNQRFPQERFNPPPA